MGTPAVTIVVPAFDVVDFIDEAIDSLRAQTREDWTAILVDDASADGTAARLDAAAASDPRFRVLRLARRRGLGAVRNLALAETTTPFVGFLDGDDRMTPRALEALTTTLDDSGSDFVVGAYVRLRPGDDGYRAGAVQPWVAAATDPRRRATTLHDHPAAAGNVVAWSKLSRTGFWRDASLRFTEDRAYEDQIVAQTMYVRARAFDAVPDVVVEWRERADGSSITQRKGTLPVLRDYLDALAGGLAVLDSSGHDAAARTRARLILSMDVPSLIRIAGAHPDDRYRRELGAFIRALRPRVGDDTTTPDLDAASLW